MPLNQQPETDRSEISNRWHWGNSLFWSVVIGLCFVYLMLILAMLIADFQFTSVTEILSQLGDAHVQYSIALSFISSTISAIVAVWFAVPIGYWLARYQSTDHRRVRLKWLSTLIIVLLDIPIFLPPIVVGISLLVLFQTPLGQIIDAAISQLLGGLGFGGIRGVTYEIPAVILAQFTVVTAFAIRTMRRCFAQIDHRPEAIARTLGASDYQVFARIAFPQSIPGVVAAFSLAWARAIGEFGPILIFAGTTRMKTEVLPTTVYLSFQSGDIGAAVAASMILISIAIVFLMAVRLISPPGTFE